MATSRPPATATSSARLATRATRARRGGADRQQRDAADLLDGAGAVEELEEARDDVDGDALLAAGAQHVEQLLVARAREGDHHALDVVPAQDVAQVVEAAEDGDVEPEVVVDLVVDDADRVEAVLAVAAQAVEQLGGDEAGADDERALAQRARAVQRTAQRRAADEGDARRASGAATSAAAIGCAAPSALGGEDERPAHEDGERREAADLRDAAAHAPSVSTA